MNNKQKQSIKRRVFTAEFNTMTKVKAQIYSNRFEWKVLKVFSNTENFWQGWISFKKMVPSTLPLVGNIKKEKKTKKQKQNKTPNPASLFHLFHILDYIYQLIGQSIPFFQVHALAQQELFCIQQHASFPSVQLQE